VTFDRIGSSKAVRDSCRRLIGFRNMDLNSRENGQYPINARAGLAERGTMIIEPHDTRAPAENQLAGATLPDPPFFTSPLSSKGKFLFAATISFGTTQCNAGRPTNACSVHQRSKRWSGSWLPAHFCSSRNPRLGRQRNGYTLRTISPSRVRPSLLAQRPL
jgi:hypothetical protein